MDQHGQQLAETCLSMLNNHDPDLVDRFVADEYRNHNAFVADGREANRQFWTGFFAALPDLSVTMEDLVISGDRVVGRLVYRGTQTGDLMGIPASGNPVEMRSIDIWRVEDGMFVEHWDELNLLEVFQQMGECRRWTGDRPPQSDRPRLARLRARARREEKTGRYRGLKR